MNDKQWCSNCHGEVDSDSVYCKYCGRKLDDKQPWCMAVIEPYFDSAVGECTCSNCNSHINIRDHYCRHCGSKIGGRKIQRKQGFLTDY